MIYFNSDYLEGAHSAIMERMMETNMMQTVGYSCDEICDSARAKIRTACEAPDADVHFLVGGTQTNRVSSLPFPATSTAMRPALSNLPAIRSSPFLPLTVRSPPSR